VVVRVEEEDVVGEKVVGVVEVDEEKVVKVKCLSGMSGKKRKRRAWEGWAIKGIKISDSIQYSKE
jgi:hypothetical protein